LKKTSATKSPVARSRWEVICPGQKRTLLGFCDCKRGNEGFPVGKKQVQARGADLCRRGKHPAKGSGMPGQMAGEGVGEKKSRSEKSQPERGGFKKAPNGEIVRQRKGKK